MLLCEDKQQSTFVYRFLIEMGWRKNQIRIRSAKPGKGSAEQYVRDQYPKELVEHRKASVSRALMVMMDGDNRKRFEDMNKRFTSLQWMGTVAFVVLGIVISVVGLQ